MSKKRIIGIITIIVLLFAAGISVGVFLYGRGETEAVNGSQTTDQNQADDENQVSEGTQNGENSEEQTTDSEDGEENTTVPDEEDVEQTENNDSENNENVNNQGVNINTVNNNQITTNTNVDEAGETTISRVEEQERLVSEDFLDWWQPMQVAIDPTIFGINRPQITVEKSAITGFGEDKVVYVGEGITYVIKVTNNSKTELKNIEITDRIPQNTTFTAIEDVTIEDKITGTKTTVTTQNKIVGVKWVVTIPAGKTATAKFTVNVNDEATGTIVNTAIANGQQSNETQTTIVKTNQSKVEINVPGEDGSKQHDEVILMVDGSYSMDNEWPHMKNTIIEIGKACLNGNGNTQLTLMAFGMGDNEVLTHVKTVSELEKALGELPGTLLYGRSSTNCEAGFTGVAEYIDSHDETLNEAYVIFISDGNINTDETPYAFDNWKNNTWLRYSVENIAKWTLAMECEHILAGGGASEAFKTFFGEDADAKIVSETSTAEQAIEWCDLVWEYVYANAGLTKGVEYPVSDVERAFVAYDEKNNTYIQDVFYYALIGRSYPERWNRTPAAGNALVSNAKVKNLYMVDYDSYTSWMDTGITAENSEYIRSTNGIAGLITALQGVITDLSKIPLNDVVATTYTSKWVSLDQASVAIVDNKTNTVIYTAEQGWLIEKDQRPTAQEVPVKIELVPASEYNNGGEIVEGNTYGDIYKITWYVKDGAMLRSDSYRLEYNVTEDYLENGFEYGISYPTNGNTFIEYKDENGNIKKEKLAK